MNRLLKIAGGLALTYLLVGGRVSAAILDRLEYEVAGIRRKDIDVSFRQGRLTALLNLRLFLRQSLADSVTVTGIELRFSQLGNHLGRISDREIVTLPTGQTKTLALPLQVSVGDFANHLAQILAGGAGQALAPITVSGQIHIQGFPSIPVSTTLNFFSAG